MSYRVGQAGVLLRLVIAQIFLRLSFAWNQDESDIDSELSTECINRSIIQAIIIPMYIPCPVVVDGVE
jgi:hypothetical protein